MVEESTMPRGCYYYLGRVRVAFAGVSPASNKIGYGVFLPGISPASSESPTVEIAKKACMEAVQEWVKLALEQG